MMTAIWSRLWDWHDETKALVLYSPKALLKKIHNQHFSSADEKEERSIDLADEMEEAPAEHVRRLKSGPGGVEEDEPREYTKRQLIGLILGPVLFVLIDRKSVV